MHGGQLTLVEAPEALQGQPKTPPPSSQSVMNPDTAWWLLIQGRLAFISSLAAGALFLACPFTSRNAEKPVLWLIAALPSTPMGQVFSSSSSSLTVWVRFSLRPLCPCLHSASSGAPSGLLPLTLRLLLPSPFSSIYQSFCLSGGSFSLGQPSGLACRCRRCRQLPSWPCAALTGGITLEVMSGGNERSMKALKEVWKRAENSLCADCGKPGESLRAAGGRVGSRELGLVSSSYLVPAVWTAQELGVERKERHCSGYLLPLPGGELAREGEGDATALVGRRAGMW